MFLVTYYRMGLQNPLTQSKDKYISLLFSICTLIGAWWSVHGTTVSSTVLYATIFRDFYVLTITFLP